MAARKLEQLQAELELLSRRYDVVVANPPYMGSKNMNDWLCSWVKKNYSDVKGDLFSCFIVRNAELGSAHAQMGFMTPYVWMFISTYEKLRKFVIEQNTITSLVQLEYSGFSGATVPICTFTLQKGCTDGYRGGYIRLSDFVGASQQAPRLLEALANPDCGWFFKLRSKDFEVIPGSPIAYWASSNSLAHFRKNETLAEHGRFLNGMSTGKNEAVVRLWSEVSVSKISFDSEKHQDFEESKAKYAPYNKGGEFRKWFGNQSDVLAYDRESNEYMDSLAGHRHNNPDTYFRRCLSWSKISSGKLAMRLFPSGFVYDVAGCSLFLNDQSEERYILALFNSSVEMRYLEFLAPTLNFEAGQIKKTPFIHGKSRERDIAYLVSDNVNLSKSDWDAFEESWNFLRHPLI